MHVSKQELRTLLERFHHADFRPGQERVIRAILDGRDALAVLPTGSGKSLVYQLVAQLLPGVTVVVSPLIALMKDQIESLQSLGFEAVHLNSSLTAHEQRREMARVKDEGAKLLYITPERFKNDEFVEWIRGVAVSLMVVDEAHCISEWGHDFRPAYLGLSGAAALVGDPPTLALTATASPWVRDDIVNHLQLDDPLVVVSDVDRPNLFFEVLRVESEDEDLAVLGNLFDDDASQYSEPITDQITSAMKGSGIVYTRTTKAAEETASWLHEWGVAADYYHGQRAQHQRDRVQEQFMTGEIRVICATNAFGLGVDKPDVRFVIHRQVPASVDEYFQEAGRAGRDGEFARCLLIYRPGDLGRAAFLAATSHITAEKIDAVAFALRDHPDFTIDELAEYVDVGKQSLAELITAMQRADLVEDTDGRLTMASIEFDPETVSTKAEDRRAAYERSRVDMIRGYAELDNCRRRYILNYFGESYEPVECDMCDNDCRVAANDWIRDEAEPVIVALSFEVGDRVEHPEWGPGTVHRVEPDSVTVLFDEVGYKQLFNEIVAERELLKPLTD